VVDKEEEVSTELEELRKFCQFKEMELPKLGMMLFGSSYDTEN
jgi:hypothetical protein